PPGAHAEGRKNYSNIRGDEPNLKGRNCPAAPSESELIDPQTVAALPRSAPEAGQALQPSPSLGRTFDSQHHGRVVEPRREQGNGHIRRARGHGAGRGPLLRRPEVRRWAHHAADLNPGWVHTDALDAPPTSTSRVERLSRLGSVGGTTVFNGPSFVLTSKIPYVASPESWVTALIDYFNPVVGMQWTAPPGPPTPRSLICYFAQLPAERSLLTISLVASAPNTVGHVSVGWVPHLGGGLPQDDHLVRYPIQGGDTDYTLDFTFERAGMAPPDWVMTLQPGIEWMLFNSVALQSAPLVVFPGVF